MNVKDSFKSPALMLLYGIVIGFAIVGAILLNSTYDDNPEVSLSNPQVSLSNPEVSLSNPEVSVTITDDTHLREEIAQLSSQVKRLETRVETLNRPSADGVGSTFADRVCYEATSRFTQGEWVSGDYDSLVDIILITMPEALLVWSYSTDDSNIHQWVSLYCWE